MIIITKTYCTQSESFKSDYFWVQYLECVTNNSITQDHLGMPKVDLHATMVNGDSSLQDLLPREGNWKDASFEGGEKERQQVSW